MNRISTNIAGFKLNNCIYNAAGVYDTDKSELLALANSQAGAIVTKSSTYLPRTGNPHPRVYYQTETNLSINSTGLANHGFRYYLEHAQEIKVANPQKPLFLSVATLTQPEITEIIREINSNKWVDLVEFNLSCPNIIGKGQVGYDLIECQELVEFISLNCQKPFGFKMPPYFEPLQLDQVVEIIKTSNAKFITCINSLGNCMIINNNGPDGAETAIYPKMGLGGVGGPALKPVALSNVYQFSQLLPDIDIIGCGGINCAQDIVDYFRCGAKAVQIGTYFWRNGLNVFATLSRDLDQLLESMDIENINDLHHKLKIREATKAN